MGDDAVFAAQQRRVTEQLGAAMLAAVGLMVRQYLGAPTGENEGQDSADAAWEDGAQAFRAGETVNESFDMARYLRLRQGASAAEPEESEGRADAEDRSRSVRRTAEKTTSARTAAAGTAGARYHTVVQGDTLWAIAARNGTTVRAVCAQPADREPESDLSRRAG